MTADGSADASRASRYRKYLKNELKAAALYSSLVRIEANPERARVFQDLQSAELGHAQVWAEKLGIDANDMPSGSLGIVGLFCIAVARVFGTNAIIPLLLWEEGGELRDYYFDPEAKDIARDERLHERVLKGLAKGQTTPVPIWDQSQTTTGTSGSLRAAVLGVNDGLVSNFSLVMGVAGGTDNPNFILLAGTAGLLAGAFSMAAGEYVSMRSQRDIYEHEIDKEEIELRDWPDEEQDELELIYRAKGLTEEEARLIARRLMADPKVALDTMAREELGLDPDELGSPWGAAFASLAAFVAGAVVPILPYLFTKGDGTVVISAVLSAVALLLVGGVLAIMSGNRPYWGALRMLLVGGAAATVTYGIGSLIGVTAAELG